MANCCGQSARPDWSIFSLAAPAAETPSQPKASTAGIGLFVSLVPRLSMQGLKQRFPKSEARKHAPLSGSVLADLIGAVLNNQTPCVLVDIWLYPRELLV
jgi:hypothetical protein